MGASVFPPALTWCLLAFSVAVGQTEKGDFAVAAMQPSVSNATQTTLTTSSNSSVSTTFTPNVNGDTTTPFGSTTRDNQTTIHQQTAPSTTVTTPLTNSPSPTTSTPAAHTPTATASTVPASETSTGHESTPGATAATSAGSPGAGSTTSHSVDKDTQGLGLNISERNLTIVFSVVLGLFAVSLVGFMFHRCRQRIQFMHQPLTNSDYSDAFGTDDDTLVISGGLYDGHPIDDNTPTAPDDQSQFRLEFIH